MGLIITDTITLDSGIQVTNAYVNIGTETIHTNRLDGPTAHDPPTSTNIYTSYVLMNIWANKEIASKKNKEHILKFHHVTVQKESEEPFDENVYSLLYTQFKNNFGYTCEDTP